MGLCKIYPRAVGYRKSGFRQESHIPRDKGPYQDSGSIGKQIVNTVRTMASFVDSTIRSPNHRHHLRGASNICRADEAGPDEG